MDSVVNEMELKLHRVRVTTNLLQFETVENYQNNYQKLIEFRAREQTRKVKRPWLFKLMVLTVIAIQLIENNSLLRRR